MSVSHHPAPDGSLESRFEIIALDQLVRPSVREGLEYWNRIRGSRPFPARAEITPRDIAPALANVILIKVLDAGTDFEVAIAGDQVVRSYRVGLLHRRVSDLAREAPGIATWWLGIYRQIVLTATPCAVRFRSGLGDEMTFSNAETVLLPLGPEGGPVDHIIGFTKRDFISA